MTSYILRRILLMIPTLLGIMLVNFLVIQAAPGGPVEQVIAQLSGHGNAITERITKTNSNETLNASSNATTDSGNAGRYRGSQGLDPEFVKELEVRFGFDKPMHERFLKMIKDYLSFDFGKSFFRDEDVVDLVLEKLPVSISLGLWTTLI
ncbi:MAG: microcin ABC transporter permease, partial [Betaproteobacteria bacterium]